MFDGACVTIVFVLAATSLGLSIAALHRATHHSTGSATPAPTPSPTGVPIVTYQVIGQCPTEAVQYDKPSLLFHGTLVVVGSGAPVQFKAIPFTITGATPSKGGTTTDEKGNFTIVATPTVVFGNQVLLTFLYPLNSVGATQTKNCALNVASPLSPTPPLFYRFIYSIEKQQVTARLKSVAITGTVYRDDTSAPVAGMSIYYVGSGNANCSPTPNPVVTDNSGLFQIFVFCSQAGEYKISLVLTLDSSLTIFTSVYNIFVV